MQNQQIKLKIEDIYESLRSLKPVQLQQQLQFYRNIVENIIGDNFIEQMRHSSQLKLTIYQLITFINEKISVQKMEKNTQIWQKSRVDKTVKPLEKITEIKQILANISKKKVSGSIEMIIGMFEFRSLMRKINSIEEELVREQSMQQRRQSFNSNDSQGMELMIEQLECLLKKKQNRIKQLNGELQQNFNDKQELEDEIENIELRCQQLEIQYQTLEKKYRELTSQNQKISNQLHGLRNHQKDQLLFGATQFMNAKLESKQVQIINVINQQSTVNQVSCEQTLGMHSDLLPQSTKLLAKYTPYASMVQQKTVKKKSHQMLQQQQFQQQNLLESLQFMKNQTIQNDDNSLQRMLLMQAIFIEHALDNIL